MLLSLSSLRYDHRGSLSHQEHAPRHGDACVHVLTAAHFNQSCQLRSTFKGLLSMETAATRPAKVVDFSARAGSFYWLGLFRPHALDAAAAHGRKKSLRLDTHRRGERARRPMQRPTQLGRCARGELEMEPDNVQKYITNEPHERPHGRLRASAMRRSGPTRCCSCRSCRSRLWAVLHARRSVQ